MDRVELPAFFRDGTGVGLGDRIGDRTRDETVLLACIAGTVVALDLPLSAGPEDLGVNAALELLTDVPRRF